MKSVLLKEIKCYLFASKLSIIMRISLFLLICCVMQTFASVSYSQTTSLTLELQNVTVEEVLNAIESKTEYRFLYNKRLVNVDRKVDVSVKDQTLSTLLNKIFADEDVKYIISDRQIVLTHAENNMTLQQANVISGKVVDVSGETIIGANIMVKGTTNGTITDIDGFFSLEAPANSILVVSYIGYMSKEVAVQGQSTLTIELIEDSQALDEVVVIGYGTVRKTDLTGAVGTMKGSDIKAQGVSNVTTSLQGKMPGVTIESAGGAPGAGARVLIRGVGTFGNSSPLYLVDGVPVEDMSNVPAGDIESMNVLKDASAAAIYGSRAANGVVLITTKSGSLGTPKINFETNLGFQKLAKKTDVLNAEEWATVSNRAYAAAGLDGLEIAKDPASLGRGTDWQDAVYRTALIQQYQLGVSGGNEIAKYSVTGGYNNQEGIVETTGYYRYNIRVKTEIKKGILKFGETFMAIHENWGNQVSGGWGSRADAVGAAALMIPAFEIYDPEAVGGYAGAYGPVVNLGNPLAQLNLRRNETTTANLINNTYAEISIFPFLKYKLNLGYTRRYDKDFDYTYRYDVGTLFTNPTNNLTEKNKERSTILLENTLSFDKRIGKHNIQALAGYTYQKYKYTENEMSNKDLPDGIFVMDAAKGVPTTNGSEKENVLLSMLGRVIYSFDDKYLLTATFRRDGSSRFASSNRYGNFPSVAVGWNVYRESFFKSSGLENVFSMLKLRGSYGVLGNQEIADYLYSSSIANNINYVIGRDQHKWVGGIQTKFATNNIKWETTRTFNVGMDAAFLDNSLSLTLDLFDKRTHDILLEVPIPISAGAEDDPMVNAGKISNKGVEVGLNYYGSAGKLNYTVFGTASHVSNKVIELGTGTQQIFGGVPAMHAASTTIAQAGGVVGEFFLQKVLGIFQTEEEVLAHSKDGVLIQPNAKPGDIKYLDANGDGMISDLDRVNCGSPFPDVEFGLGFNGNMYGFDLSVYFQGVTGNKIYNGMRHELEGMTLGQNYSKATLNAWTPENRSTSMPRAVINDPNYNSYSSSRFLEDGSYVRLKTLQIGYNFEKSIIQKIYLGSLRVYMSADNLFTITGYKGSNPDLGGKDEILNRGVDFSKGSYPLARTFTFGLQVSL